MTVDLDKLEALARAARSRADAAHAGPWHIHEGDLVDANHQDVFTDWEEAYGPNEDEVGPDTTFICAAQQDVVALTDTINQLIAETRANADVIVDLKRELTGYYGLDDSLKNAHAKLRVAVEALEFYADENNHRLSEGAFEFGSDGGEMARTALATLSAPTGDKP